MRVENLYRYPVKGLSAEALEYVDLAPGQALPWDRTFALAQGDSGFDPAAPEFRPKFNFMCLLKNERIAGLRAGFDPYDGTLAIEAPDGSSVRASPLSAEGRVRIGTFLTGFLGAEARGEPIFQHVPGHVFGDQREPVVSLVSLTSLHAFERDVAAVRDKMRFRANIYFTGAEPWLENDWVDRQIEVGGATLLVVKRTRRCNATQVNPETTERDADPVRELMRAYGHTDLGVHARVVEGGRIAVGDALVVRE